MSENKHYGRQILLSLFLTVFILLGLLYLASRYVLPLYSINQEQIYDVLVKLFPLLIGLIMIEIGVLVARRRDEDFADEIDKLPPNAYDKPLYTLPGDDPLHRHTDEMVLSQNVADTYKPSEHVLAPEDELIRTPARTREAIQPTFSKVEDTDSYDSNCFEVEPEAQPIVAPTTLASAPLEKEKPVEKEYTSASLQSLSLENEEPVAAQEEYTSASLQSTSLEKEEPVAEEEYTSTSLEETKPVLDRYAPTSIDFRSLEEEKPVAVDSRPIHSSTIQLGARSSNAEFYSTDFSSILSVELENAQEMDYDLTLVLVDVSKGPAEQIANKMIMLSGELAYSFTLENNRIAMVLPFYNAEEARSFTLSLLESCKKEFSGASLQIGFASRNGRVLDSSLLLHEAVTACMLEDDDEYESKEDDTEEYADQDENNGYENKYKYETRPF